MQPATHLRAQQRCSASAQTGGRAGNSARPVAWICNVKRPARHQAAAGGDVIGTVESWRWSWGCTKRRVASAEYWEMPHKKQRQRLDPTVYSGLEVGRSVAACRSVTYCAGVRRLRHSSSLCATCGAAKRVMLVDGHVRSSRRGYNLNICVSCSGAMTKCNEPQDLVTHQV